MTNKEAIEDIKNNILPVVGGKSLVMAIKALEEQERPTENVPTIRPRIEYGTDGQPYELSISGGHVVPDVLQGWKYQEVENEQ